MKYFSLNSGKLSRLINKYLNRKLKAIEINSSEFFVLAHINEFGFLSGKHATDWFGLDITVCGRFINSLIADGLIKRDSWIQLDRIRNTFCLTRAGKKILKKADVIIKETEDFLKELWEDSFSANVLNRIHIDNFPKDGSLESLMIVVDIFCRKLKARAL